MVSNTYFFSLYSFRRKPMSFGFWKIQAAKLLNSLNFSEDCYLEQYQTQQVNQEAYMVTSPETTSWGQWTCFACKIPWDDHPSIVAWKIHGCFWLIPNDSHKPIHTILPWYHHFSWSNCVFFRVAQRSWQPGVVSYYHTVLDNGTMRVVGQGCAYPQWLLRCLVYRWINKWHAQKPRGGNSQNVFPGCYRCYRWCSFP